jgi:hypothetical protein
MRAGLDTAGGHKGGSMDDKFALANQHLTEARALLQAEDTRLTADLALVRQKIRAIDAALVMPSGAAPLATDEGRPAEPPVERAAERPAERVIALPAPRRPQPAPQGSPDLQAWARKLRGLTHPEALVRMAQEQGGLVRSADATRILVGIGHVKGKRENVSSHMHRLLRQSDRFVQIGVGTFRLVEDAGKSGKDEPLAPAPPAEPTPTQDQTLDLA